MCTGSDMRGTRKYIICPIDSLNQNENTEIKKLYLFLRNHGSRNQSYILPYVIDHITLACQTKSCHLSWSA